MDKKKPDPPSGFSEKQEEFDASVHDHWPNSFRTREELDAMLEAGMASGISPRRGEEIFDAAIASLKDE